MNKFKRLILTTKKPDLSKWQEIVSRHPREDIFFTPEYALLFEGTEGKVRQSFAGEAQLFFYGNEENYIIYPFFKRKLSDLPFYDFLPPEFRGWFDIVSPYGYSGPISHITQADSEGRLWQEFFQEFHNYCVENKIVSEFARLHPYIKNHIFIEKCLDIRKRGRIVYIDLTQDLSAIKKGLDKGNKASLSKAVKNGIEIFRSENKEDADAFYELYLHTMERNEAEGAYIFSRKFFDNLFHLLAKYSSLFCARYKDKIIAASLFLFKKDFFHYYLSGSDAGFLSLCPNNLLLYETISWAKEQGFKIFNLGGGFRENDSLFSFKSSFSKTSLEFYTYSRIHNEEAYRILCVAKENSRTDKRLGEAGRVDYFPAYRS